MSKSLTIDVITAVNDHDGYCSGGECEFVEFHDLFKFDNNEYLHEIDSFLEKNGFHDTVLAEFPFMKSNIRKGLSREYEANDGKLNYRDHHGSGQCRNSKIAEKYGIEIHEHIISRYRLRLEHTERSWDTGWIYLKPCEMKYKLRMIADAVPLYKRFLGF